MVAAEGSRPRGKAAQDERPYQAACGLPSHFPGKDWKFYAGPEDDDVPWNAPTTRPGAAAALHRWLELVPDPLAQPPLNVDALPVQRILLRRDPDKLPDRIIGFGSSDHLWVVSDRFRDIVEGLEPGKHHFFPYEVLKPDRSTWPVRFWGFSVGQAVQALIVEQSDLTWGKLPEPTRTGLTHRIDGMDRRYATKVLDRVAINGRHLWQEALYGRWLLFSAELVRRVRSAKLRGFNNINEDLRVGVEERRFPPPKTYDFSGKASL